MRTNGSPPMMSNIPARVIDFIVKYLIEFMPNLTIIWRMTNALRNNSRTRTSRTFALNGDASARQHAARNPNASAVHLNRKRIKSRSSSACAA